MKKFLSLIFIVLMLFTACDSTQTNSVFDTSSETQSNDTVIFKNSYEKILSVIKKTNKIKYPTYYETSYKGVDYAGIALDYGNSRVVVPYDSGKCFDVFVDWQFTGFAYGGDNDSIILVKTSEDMAVTWTESEIDLEDEKAKYFYISFSDSGVGYLAVTLENSEPCLYVTQNKGVSWEKKDVGNVFEGTSISGITVLDEDLYIYGRTVEKPYSPVLLISKNGQDIKKVDKNFKPDKYEEGRAYQDGIYSKDGIIVFKVVMEYADETLEKNYYISEDNGETWNLFEEQ